MDDYRIRQAGPEDGDGILALINHAALAGDTLYYHVGDAFGHRRVYEKLAVWIAEDGAGKIVGTLSGGIKRVLVRNQPNWIGYAFHLRVASGLRRSGIASMMSETNRKWMAEQGAEAHLCLVGPENIASVKFVESVGYRKCGTVFFIRIRRGNAGLVGELAPTVDVTSSAEWRERLNGYFAKLELCPVPLLDIIYPKKAGGGYLQTIYVESSAGFSWASVWDKDRLLGRRTVDPENSTIFLCDATPGEPEAISRIVRTCFTANPEAKRIVMIVNELHDVQTLVSHLAKTFAVECHADNIMLRNICADGFPYVDVRD